MDKMKCRPGAPTSNTTVELGGILFGLPATPKAYCGLHMNTETSPLSMDETPTSQAFSTCPVHEMMIVRPSLEAHDQVFTGLSIVCERFTFADVEAKRLLAVLGGIKLLHVQKPPSVMDGHFVSDHRPFPRTSWTLHNLQRHTSILTEYHDLQAAFEIYREKKPLNVWQKNTLMTPLSLSGVTSTPFNVNRATVDWPSRGRSWSVFISAKSGTLKSCPTHMHTSWAKVPSFLYNSNWFKIRYGLWAGVPLSKAPCPNYSRLVCVQYRCIKVTGRSHIPWCVTIFQILILRIMCCYNMLTYAKKFTS